MRRFVTVVLMMAAVTFGLAACGGGGKKAGPPATVTITPNPVSLTVGFTQQLTVVVTDASGTVLASPTVTFASSNPSVVSVSTTGLLCGGSWDPTFVVCTPPSPAVLGAGSTATITATAAPASGTVPVFAHVRIDNIVLSPATAASDIASCISQNGTDVFTAHAFGQVSGTQQEITSSVGPFTWSVSPTGVATVTPDATGQSATVTAALPGQTTVFANAAGTTSSALPAAVFTTCPVKSIAVTPTTFTATSTLTATTTDSKGVALANIPLQWNSSAPATFGVTSGALTSTATSGSAGAATVVASCTPPACNTNLYPVYGNAVVGTVAGASATTVWVASTASTSLLPIDTGSNAIGAAVTLPVAPNSMLGDPGGTRLYLGADDRIMTASLATSPPAVTSTANVSGKILTVSPDGNLVVLRSPAASPTSVLVFSSSNNAVLSLSIAGATHADFSPDGQLLYISTPSAVWKWANNTTPVIISGGANDVGFLAQGSFAFLAGTGSEVRVQQTCDNTQKTTVGTPSAPLLVNSLPDATKVLTADASTLNAVSVSTDGVTSVTTTPPITCSTNLASATLTDTKATGFTPAQIIVAPNSTKAFLPSATSADVLAYTLGSGAVTPIALTATGATHATTGGITLDSSSVFVGLAGSNTVERIDATALTDAVHISGFPSGFTPDFVVVRAK